MAIVTEPGRQLDQLTFAVIGAAIEVYRALGPGFLEAVYEEALCVELALRDIPFERQKPIKVKYKGIQVGKGRLDLLVDSLLVVELKSVRELAPIHTAIAISYLKIVGSRLALIINFQANRLKDGIRRVVLSSPV